VSGFFTGRLVLTTFALDMPWLCAIMCSLLGRERSARKTGSSSGQFLFAMLRNGNDGNIFHGVFCDEGV
jgi:hypothetical protein